MSDVLTSPVSKFDTKVNFCSKVSPVVAHRNYVDTESVEVNLQLSSKFLHSLNLAKCNSQLTYVQLLNSQLSAFQLIDGCKLENRIRSACCKVVSYYKSVNGGAKRQAFQKKEHTIIVYKGEIIDAQLQSCKLLDFYEQKAVLESKCKELFLALLHEQKKNEQLVQTEKENEYLKSRNDFLCNYLDTLDCNQYLNSGKKYDECQSRQKFRKIKTLENYAQKALAFAETFGIKPVKLSCISEGGRDIILNLDRPESVDNSSYQNLSSEEKEKNKEIVFLCDKFFISDAAYHELAMCFDEMPRKYIVVQCRETLGSIFHIERLPGNVPGAMINLKSEVKRILSDHIKKNGNDCNKFFIKFSGDGARVSRISNYVIFSIQIVLENCSLSYNDLHTIAIVNCSESYENLKTTCQPIFMQLNELAEQKQILIDDTNVELQLFMCGDMKFVQILLGLCGLTGNYACPWCKVHKHNRHDVTKPWNFYHSADMFRSYSELCTLSNLSKNTFGVKHMPLIKVDIDHIVPDELHLMLRITDVMLRNVIFDSKDKDELVKSSANSGENCNYLQMLVDLIQSCGVSFKVWYSKGAYELEWTSLSGSEKSKLLKLLHVKLSESDVLHSETKDLVVKLWQDFYTLYLFVNSDDCQQCTGEEIFCKIKAWVTDFLLIGEKRKGYLKENVSPYIHCFLYHVPTFVTEYGSLRQFSSQGVEKNNDVVKTIHQRKSSKLDGPTEALRVRKID